MDTSQSSCYVTFKNIWHYWPFLLFDILFPAWFPGHCCSWFFSYPTNFYLLVIFGSFFVFFSFPFLWFLNDGGPRSHSLVLLKFLYTYKLLMSLKDLHKSHGLHVDNSVMATKFISRMVCSLNSRFMYFIDYLRFLLTCLIVISNLVCSKLSFPCFFPNLLLS